MRQKKKIRKKKLAYGNIASSAKCVICRNVVYTFDGLNNGAKVKKKRAYKKMNNNRISVREMVDFKQTRKHSKMFKFMCPKEFQVSSNCVFQAIHSCCFPRKVKKNR